MSEYKYINDAEREWTEKYEGTYTPEEIEYLLDLAADLKERKKKPTRLAPRFSPVSAVNLQWLLRQADPIPM